MLLLDTCALIWYGAGKPDMSKKALSAIEENKDALFVSVASAMEIAIKERSGKLQFEMAASEWYKQSLETFGITEIAIDSVTAFHAAHLEPIHNDPFDRIIIATAAIQKLDIVTSDSGIRRYKGVKVIW